ncbi:chaperone modulator CbpM [Roseovarius sp.]|uniref:chaperone modulator CbpM n=1 Tax=Roseovarius sp. TaxID=1486281 RepID=UPI0025F48C9F|nr:chaperone modulator CbpM [Roseovarius sp.]
MAQENALVPVCDVVTSLSLTELCRVSGSSADWIMELVEEGILEPAGPDRSAWIFESTSLSVIQTVQRLQSDLRINLPGVAVVLTLAEENARLARRLTQFEAGPDPSIWMPAPKR